MVGGPIDATSMSEYSWAIRHSNGMLEVPENMSPGELEWEYYISKLHWKYKTSTKEDLDKIKEIANRL